MEFTEEKLKKIHLELKRKLARIAMPLHDAHEARLRLKRLHPTAYIPGTIFSGNQSADEANDVWGWSALAKEEWAVFLESVGIQEIEIKEDISRPEEFVRSAEWFKIKFEFLAAWSQTAAGKSTLADNVLVIDPSFNTASGWLKMTKETAEKILILGA